MKKIFTLISLCVLSYLVNAQTTNNLNFSSGNTTGWAGAWTGGAHTNAKQAFQATITSCSNPLTAGFNSSSTNSLGYVHEIVTAGTDPHVPIQRVPPGHTYALRLGNDFAWANEEKTYTTMGLNHQTISNTFTVTAQNANLTYWMATVFSLVKGNSHQYTDAPYVNVKVYDKNCTQIYSCSAFNAIENGYESGYGFVEQDSLSYDGFTGDDEAFEYHDWQSMKVPLQSYIGQQVTIIFETCDCSDGTHFAYSYVAVDVAPSSTISLSNPYICNGAPLTLTGPAGFGTYSWSGNGLPIGTNTLQTLQVTTPGTYSLTLSEPVTGCGFTIDTVIKAGPNVVISPLNQTICIGANATLTASGASTYTWNTNATGSVFTPAPTGSTTYTVTGADASGCTYTNTATVDVDIATVYAYSTSMCSGTTTTLTANGTTTYTWMPGNIHTPTIAINPTASTNYTVTGKDGFNCASTQSLTVTVYTCNSPTTCSDYDFDNGTFSGLWQGQRNVTNTQDATTGYGVLSFSTIDNSGRDSLTHVQEICDAGFDPYVPNLKRLAPGHSLSLRLGNDVTYNGAPSQGHQTITRYFTPTATSTYFTYWVAFVCNGVGNGVHPTSVEPFFQAKFYDPNNNEIQYTRNYIGGTTTSGFAMTTATTVAAPPDPVGYLEWKQYAVNLSSYVNTPMHVTFETADCAYGEHFGYAYIDIECPTPVQITETSQYYCPYDTLTATPGYASYNWTNAGVTGVTNTNTLVVNGGTYFPVTLTNNFGTQYSTAVYLWGGGLKPVASYSINQACMGAAATFTNQSTNTPTTWLWNFGDTDTTSHTLKNPTHTYTTAGAYTVTLKASNVCGTDSIKQIVNAFSHPTLSLSKTCATDKGIITASASAGSSPYKYNLNHGAFSSVNIFGNLTSGTYTAYVSDAHTCKDSASIIVSDSCNLVWPGDANNDLVADNNDILAIGIGNNTSGTTRNNATINWTGQPAINWIDTLITSVNFKHIDCDGNGTINLNDTLAVIQNYSLTHPAGRLSNNNQISTSGVPLTLIPQQNNVLSGNAGVFDIMLGNSTTPVNNGYGIAFTVQFNNSYIDATSIGINGNGSWMGSINTNLMAIALKGATQAECAITKTDHNNVSGNGKIGEITFKTLAGITSNPNTAFTISNVNFIAYNQSTIPIDASAATGTITIVNGTTNISTLNNHASVQIYPNPAQNNFTIEPNTNEKQIVEVYDVNGKLILQQTINGKTTIDVSNLNAGVYNVNVTGNAGIVNTHLVLVK